MSGNPRFRLRPIKALDILVGPHRELHESHIEFIRSLIEQGRMTGVPVLEHILIQDNMFRVMSESMGRWITERA